MPCPDCAQIDPHPSAPARPAGTCFAVALAGNPNAGKTTLFNALTGARQRVGNWPGKTVERREGACEIVGHTLTIIDLPGTYSLSAYTAEEVIAMDALLDEHLDLVLVVLDAGNLERNLYLAYQIIEMGLPVLVVLNMMDSAAARGLRIDTGRLAAGLGVPVVEAVAVRGEGVDNLRAAILRVLQSHPLTEVAA